MSGSGSNPFFERDRNRGTVIVTMDQLSLVPRWTVQDQFERFYDEIRSIATAPGLPGYDVVAMGTDGMAFVQLPAVPPGEPAGVLVVGRHTSAEMCLSGDPTIALRHLTIRVVVGADGEPETRLIDLNTGQGFGIERAGHFHGARISGPAFVRIGSYALMLFPRREVPEIWPASPEGVFDRLVSARVVEPDEEKAEAVPAVAGNKVGFRRETVITRVGPPVAPRRQRRVGSIPADTVAVLTVEHVDGRTLYPLNEQHLERGVLLGRYGRCEVELQDLWVNEAASRVHLLLLKDGDRYLAIDTASSNGTFVDDELISVAALPDDADIEIAPDNLVRWQVVEGEGAAMSSSENHSPRSESRPACAERNPPKPKVLWQPLVVPPEPGPEPELEPEQECDLASPFRPASVIGASAWSPKVSNPENLPSVLDLVDPEARNLVTSPWPAIIIALLGLVLILTLAVYSTVKGNEPTAEARRCIHPVHDFGTDSPALRLYLQHQDPDVCFQYRWSPWVEQLLNVPEPTGPEPDWLP